MSTAAVASVAAPPEGQPSYLTKLLNGDLSGLSTEEQTAYYLERCRSIGVDPASQPFLFMQTKDTPPKTILYVTRSATDQIGKREGLTERIVSKELVNGIAVVVVRVTDGKREVENIGAAGFRQDYQAGDALKRATTQAYRRAIIQFAGVGAVSEEDIDDIPGAEKVGMASVVVPHTNRSTGEIIEPQAPRPLNPRPQSAAPPHQPAPATDSTMASEAQIKAIKTMLAKLERPVDWELLGSLTKAAASVQIQALQEDISGKHKPHQGQTPGVADDDDAGLPF